MKVYQAPEPYELSGPSVFLAGSIDMGAAENIEELIGLIKVRTLF